MNHTLLGGPVRMTLVLLPLHDCRRHDNQPHVVFPDHLPERGHSGLQRTLRRNIGPLRSRRLAINVVCIDVVGPNDRRIALEGHAGIVERQDVLVPILGLVLWALSLGTRAEIFLLHLLQLFKLFVEAGMSKHFVCLLIQFGHPSLDGDGADARGVERLRHSHFLAILLHHGILPIVINQRRQVLEEDPPPNIKAATDVPNHNVGHVVHRGPA
mmetsp:Transcript_24786/g.64550  ORF Transcript_24786/g.64550 Transcript_24786/m.64550 type:complete len:213 (+) Transcript_24786:652-1290(+)